MIFVCLVEQKLYQRFSNIFVFRTTVFPIRDRKFIYDDDVNKKSLKFSVRICFKIIFLRLLQNIQEKFSQAWIQGI